MQIEKKVGGMRVVEHYRRIETISGEDNTRILTHITMECECGGKGYQDGERTWCNNPACQWSKEYSEYIRQRAVT